jgi:uncharacterized protein YbaP (TraB family)
VSTPKSELWIVGLAGPTPKRLEWDTRRVEAALDGAHELILPPGASIGMLDMVGLLLDPSHRYHYPGGQTLRGAMSPDQRRKFDAAAASVGQDPAHYDHWRPLVVFIALVADAQKHDGLNMEGPQKTLMHLAEAKKVPTRRLTNYSTGSMIQAFKDASPQDQERCLALAVDMAPRLPAFSARLGEAWAHGQVDAALGDQAEIVSDACFTSTPGFRRLEDRRMQDWAKGLAQTLQQPGKTVLAIDIRSLTSPGGLLEQLKAQGLEVTGRAY